MTSLRGALIGTGYSAALQLRAWSQIDSVDIVALAGRDRRRADERASEFGVPRAYDDYRRMLATEDLDFVDIATPPASHEELVVAAATSGLHILCQKPAAEDLATMRRMIEACRAAGVTFGINENCRFQPWYRSIRRRLDDGDLGEVNSATFTSRARLSLPLPRFETQPFFVGMPRLILYELGVHFFDTARYLFGPATSVYAITQRVSRHVAGEDAALAVTTHGSTTVTLDLSWAHHPTGPTSGRGWAEVAIDGTTASLRLTRDGLMQIVGDEGERCESFEGDMVHEGYRAAQSHFAECILDGHVPETSASDQLATLELVFGAYESARAGEVYHVGRDIGRLA